MTTSEITLMFALRPIFWAILVRLCTACSPTRWMHRGFLGWRLAAIFVVVGLACSLIALVAAGSFTDRVAAAGKHEYRVAPGSRLPLAEQRRAAVQHKIGLMYARGYGVERDYAEAARWYRRAAEQGYAPSQSNLGLMYDYGYGVKKDYVEAARWYRKAAEQGDARAQFNLGFLYRNGHGVDKDQAEAVRWYRKAAEQDNARAQLNLGFIYANGYGVAQDDVQAYVWFSLAADRGDQGASTLKYIVAKRMTPAQIVKAQTQAAWVELQVLWKIELSPLTD